MLTFGGKIGEIRSADLNCDGTAGSSSIINLDRRRQLRRDR
jgi:hypothetical protein